MNEKQEKQPPVTSPLTSSATPDISSETTGYRLKSNGESNGDSPPPQIPSKEPPIVDIQSDIPKEDEYISRSDLPTSRSAFADCIVGLPIKARNKKGSEPEHVKSDMEIARELYLEEVRSVRNLRTTVKKVEKLSLSFEPRRSHSSHCKPSSGRPNPKRPSIEYDEYDSMDDVDVDLDEIDDGIWSDGEFSSKTKTRKKTIEQKYNDRGPQNVSEYMESCAKKLGDEMQLEKALIKADVSTVTAGVSKQGEQANVYYRPLGCQTGDSFKANGTTPKINHIDKLSPEIQSTGKIKSTNGLEQLRSTDRLCPKSDSAQIGQTPSEKIQSCSDSNSKAEWTVDKFVSNGDNRGPATRDVVVREDEGRLVLSVRKDVAASVIKRIKEEKESRQSQQLIDIKRAILPEKREARGDAVLVDEETILTSYQIKGLDHFRSIVDKNILKEEKQRDALANIASKKGLKRRRSSLDTRGKEKPARDWSKATFINCDLCYFNLSSLGKFDAIMIDPPWRIKGADTANPNKTMFSNCRFSLEYMTLSNQEIIDIDVGCLSDNGFIFLWVINSQMEFSLECLAKWGYTFIDKITWVKKTTMGNIAISQGWYFLHSTETCLVGVKGRPEFISKVSNDVLFAEVREKSRKPDQIYEIVERMVPGGRKIEIFARNHNLREGWLSLGNQLGEYYDWGHDRVQCDQCHKTLEIGIHRYKSKTQANHDLCEDCWRKQEDQEAFFFIENVTEEMIFHQYYSCNGCETKPLWGIRFHCKDCGDFDLCESCYDAKVIPEGSSHKHDHTFQAIETPELAGGLPVHRERCLSCYAYPIIGYRFLCRVCTKTSLCQKCFFNKKEPKNHLITHDTELIIDPINTVHLSIKCDACGIAPILGTRYKCNSCFNYDLCEMCYENDAPIPMNDASHRPSHKFTRLSAPS